METLKRSFKSAKSNIRRQKFISFATVLIFVVFFMVTNLLAIAYYSLYKVANYLETRPNITVWFQIGTEEADILALKTKIENEGKTAEVIYFSEVDSANDFLEMFKDQPIYTQTVVPNEAGQINARLNIKPLKIEYLRDLTQDLTREKEENSIIEDVSSEVSVANRLNDILSILRITMIISVILFLAIIVSLDLVSVQFSMQNRSEEIKVMQLVGASKTIIRQPYILEGTILGGLAGLIASIVTGLIIVIGVLLNNYSPTIQAFTRIFAEVRWPNITATNLPLLLIAFVLLQVFAGMTLGSFANYIAVRKQIK